MASTISEDEWDNVTVEEGDIHGEIALINPAILVLRFGAIIILQVLKNLQMIIMS